MAAGALTTSTVPGEGFGAVAGGPDTADKLKLAKVWTGMLDEALAIAAGIVLSGVAAVGPATVFDAVVETCGIANAFRNMRSGITPASLSLLALVAADCRELGGAADGAHNTSGLRARPGDRGAPAVSNTDAARGNGAGEEPNS